MNTFTRFGRVFVLLMVFAFSYSLVQGQDDVENAHLEALALIADQGLTQGDASVLEMHMADDYVVHTPFGDLNRDAVQGLFAAFRAAMPDFHIVQEDAFASGDSVALRATMAGTFESEFTAPFGVFPPTGELFHLEINYIFHFNDEGKIQEEWAKFDTAAMMAALGAMPAPAPAAEGVMSEEAAAHFVEVFDSFFVGPNPDVLDEIFAPDFVSHLPLAPDLDLEAFKGYVTSFYGGVSDMTQVTNQVIIGEERLVIHVTYYGTHDGELFGVPATGNAITMNGIGIFRFNEDGLAVENWAVLDMAGVLAQIGALPS